MEVEKLRKFAPLAVPHIEGFRVCFDRYKIDQYLLVCHFLAQLAHESGGFRYVKEIWGPTEAQRKYNLRADLGNTRPEAVALAKHRNDIPGHFYMGHGFIQNTGYDNHLSYSMEIYGDNRCAVDPTMLTRSPDVVLSAGWFWGKNKLNQLALQDDVVAVTKRINGGTNGLQDRKAWLAKAKEIFK